MSDEAVNGDQQREAPKIKELPRSLEELSENEAEAVRGGAVQMDGVRTRRGDTCWIENSLEQKVRILPTDG